MITCCIASFQLCRITSWVNLLLVRMHQLIATRHVVNKNKLAQCNETSPYNDDDDDDDDVDNDDDEANHNNQSNIINDKNTNNKSSNRTTIITTTATTATTTLLVKSLQDTQETAWSLPTAEALH
jgi:hypothetical protein